MIKRIVSVFCLIFALTVLISCEDIPLYKTHTVTFDSVGGTAVDEQLVLEGHCVQKPEDPVKPGFEFGGWFTDGKYTKAYDFGLQVKSSFALVAKWNEIGKEKYTVTYVANGGEGTVPVDPTQYLEGDKVTLKSGETLSKKDATFTGWEFNKATYQPGTIYTMPDHNVIFSAIWTETAKTYKVIFDPDGGEPTPLEQVIEAGKKAQEPNNPTKIGYVFDCWATADGTIYNFDNPVNSSFTLKAKWIQASTYAVIYNANFPTSGSAPQDINSPYIAGAEVTVKGKGNIERTGYTFTGWKHGSKIYKEGDKFAMPSASVEFIANWEPITHKVKFDADGGSPVPSEQTVNQGECAKKPSDVKKKAYVFLAWYKGDTEYNFSTPVTEDITLKAHYRNAVQVTVSFDGNGATSGTAPEAIDTYEGESITLPTKGTLSKGADWTFSGWRVGSPSSGVKKNAGESFTTDEDVTLYADWVQTYKLSFDTNEGTGTAPADIFVPYGQTTTLPTPPKGMIKEGYACSGWLKDSVSGTHFDFKSVVQPTADTVYFAEWSPGYKVTYDGNGNTSGVAPSPEYVVIGRPVTVPDAGSLKKTNFVFTGWRAGSPTSSVHVDEGTTYVPTSDITLYAEWSDLVLTDLTYQGSWENEQNISSAVDPTGITFYAHYSDGSEHKVSDVTKSKETWSATPGVQTCRFTYKENNVSKYVDIDAKVFKKYYFFDGNNLPVTTKTIKGLALVKTYSNEENGEKKAVGGRIFYIHDEPTMDRYFVYDINTGLLDTKSWGFKGIEVGKTEDGIGKGKTNTAAALAKDDTSVLVQTSIWTALKAINMGLSGGCDDWYIGSSKEIEKLKESGLVTWFTKYYIWSSREDVANASTSAYSWSPQLATWLSDKKDVKECSMFAIRSI